jgi:hypothetical protein
MQEVAAFPQARLRFSTGPWGEPDDLAEPGGRLRPCRCGGLRRYGAGVTISRRRDRGDSGRRADLWYRGGPAGCLAAAVLRLVERPLPAGKAPQERPGRPIREGQPARPLAGPGQRRSRSGPGGCLWPYVRPANTCGTGRRAGGGERRHLGDRSRRAGPPPSVAPDRRTARGSGHVGRGDGGGNGCLPGRCDADRGGRRVGAWFACPRGGSDRRRLSRGGRRLTAGGDGPGHVLLPGVQEGNRAPSGP